MKIKHLCFAKLVIVALFCSPIPCSAAAATLYLLDELTVVWLQNHAEMEEICEIGGKLNKDVLSFWNPVIASKRVEAFSGHLNEARLYVNSQKELDQDTLSAFADAKEAALLRAMRKKCPEVW